MSPSAEKHLQRKPFARPSTLRQLEKRDEVTARLQRENMERILKEQLDRTPRAWWKRGSIWPSWVWR